MPDPRESADSTTATRERTLRRRWPEGTRLEGEGSRVRRPPGWPRGSRASPGRACRCPRGSGRWARNSLPARSGGCSSRWRGCWSRGCRWRPRSSRKGGVSPAISAAWCWSARGRATLGQVLGRYIEYHEVGAELRRRTWLSLAYPILAIAASLVLFVFVSFLLVNDVAPISRGLQGRPAPADPVRPEGRDLVVGELVVAPVRSSASWSRPGSCSSWPCPRRRGGAWRAISRCWDGSGDGRRWRSSATSWASCWRATSRWPGRSARRRGGAGRLAGCRVAAGGARRRGGRYALGGDRAAVDLPRRPVAAAAWAEGKRALAETLHMAGDMLRGAGPGPGLLRGHRLRRRVGDRRPARDRRCSSSRS